jgi:hypothetical protein
MNTLNTHTLNFLGDDFRLGAADNGTDLVVLVGGHVFVAGKTSEFVFVAGKTSEFAHIVLAVVEAVVEHPNDLHTITINTDTLQAISITRNAEVAA